MAAPGQVFPPFLGAGLLQRLVLFLIPPPQVLVHLVKGPQLLHRPFTMIYEISLIRLVYIQSYNKNATTYCNKIA